MRRLYIDGRWYQDIENLPLDELQYLARYCQQMYENYSVHPERQEVHVIGLRERMNYLNSVLRQKTTAVA